MPKEIFSETKINRSHTSFYSLWNIMVFSTAIFYIWNDYISIIKTRIHFSKNICIYISSVHLFSKRRLIKGTAFLFPKDFRIYHTQTTILYHQTDKYISQLYNNSSYLVIIWMIHLFFYQHKLWWSGCCTKKNFSWGD